MGKAKKDSESFVPSNQFEEFNKQLAGGTKKDVNGKEVSVQPDDTNPLAAFNAKLKKKDPLQPTSTPESGSKEFQGASTSLFNGKFAPPNFITGVGATDFLLKDFDNSIGSGGVEPVKIYPSVGPDGQPVVDQAATQKRKDEMLSDPTKLRQYIDQRSDAIGEQIKQMKEIREGLVRQKSSMRGGEIEKPKPGERNDGVNIITDPGYYDKLTANIMKMEGYLGEMKNNVTEVVGQALIKKKLSNIKYVTGDIEQLGRDIIRFSNREVDGQFSALERNKKTLGPVPVADMQMLGITAWKKYLAENPDIEQHDYLTKSVAEYEKDFEERNYQLTAARVRHKIGAYLHKKSGSSVFRDHPSEQEIIDAAQQSNLSPTELKIFNNYVLPVERANPGTEIPMSGFVLKFGEALQQGMHNIGNIGRSDIDRIKEGLNEELNTGVQEVGEFERDKVEYFRLKEKEKTKEGVTSVEKEKMKQMENYVNVRTWYDKFWDGSGDLTGQVFYQATLARLGGTATGLLGKLPGASTIATVAPAALKNKDAVNLMVTSFLTSYDGHAKEAALMMPGEKDAINRRLYAYTMAGVEGLSERIFNDTKVLDAFKKGITPDVVKLVKRVSAKEITNEAAMNRLQQILQNKIKPFAKEFLKAEVQEGTEEAVVDIAQGIAESVFGGKEFNPDATIKNAANTFLTTMAYSPFVSTLAAVKDVRTSAMGKSGIYKMATNPELYTREIYDQHESGALTQEEVDQKIKIINTANKILTQIPTSRSGESKNPNVPKGLDYPERVNYLTHRLNEALLEEQIAATTDEVVKADLIKKRDRSKNIREAIYNGEVVSGNNMEEIALDDKVAENLGVSKVTDVEPDGLPYGFNTVAVDKINKAKWEDVDEINKKIDALDKNSPTYFAQFDFLRKEKSDIIDFYDSQLNNISQQKPDKNVESTADALQEFQKLPLRQESLTESEKTAMNTYYDILKGNNLVNAKELSAAYHKAKADGSNPELVKAVANLLSNISQQKPDNNEEFKQGQQPDKQAGKESGSSQYSGEENSPEKQAVRQGEVDAEVLNEEPGADVSLPPGFTQEQFNQLPENIQQKLRDRVPKQQKAAEESAAPMNEKSNELLGKNLDKLNDIYQNFATTKPNDFLKFVAQQANNINDQDKVNSNTDTREAAQRDFAPEIIEAANLQFPQYKQAAQRAEDGFVDFKSSDGKTMQGKKIEIPGYEDIDMVLVKDGFSNEIYELASGMKIADSKGAFSEQDAVNEIRDVMASKNITSDRIYKKIRRPDEPSYAGDSKINLKNESPAFENYRERQTEAYNALPDLYDDDEKAVISRLVSKAKAFGEKDMVDFLSNKLNEKKSGRTMNLDVDRLGEMLDRRIAQTNLKELRAKNEPYPEDAKELIDTSFEKFQSAMNTGYKTNQFAKFPEEIVQPLYQAWKKEAEIYNKYGYWPESIKSKNPADNTMIAGGRYIVATNSKNATPARTKNALEAIKESIKFVDKIYAQEFPQGAPAVVEQPAATQEQPPEVSTEFVNVPLDQIFTDTERFQPRENKFSQETFDKIVNDYDQNKMLPVTLFKDADGRDYILAGHSRFEAHKELTSLPDGDQRKAGAIENGFVPGQIQAKYFVGNEQEAIEFASRSNDLGTRNKDYESAAAIRKMREAGTTKRDIQEQAKQDFGKNWRYIFALSYLNPTGKTMQAVKQFEGSTDRAMVSSVERAAQWIGATRERMVDQLTNQHENEMYDFLMDKTRATKLDRENDFIGMVQNIVGRFDFNPAEPLNIARLKNKSTAEVNYDAEEAELKETIKDREKELDTINERLNNPQNAQFINPSSSDYADVLRVAEQKKNQLNQELTALRRELVAHRLDKGKAISQGVAQPSLFDLNNLTPTEQADINNELAEDGITLENIEAYEQTLYEPEEVQEQGVPVGQQSEVLPTTVRESEDEQGTDTQQDQGGTAVQGRKRTSPAVENLIGAKNGAKPNPYGVFAKKEGNELRMDSKKIDASIFFLELENGKWISAYEFSENDGSSSAPLDLTKTFDTKEDAVMDAVGIIEDRSKDQAFVKWIEQVKQEYSSPSSVKKLPVISPENRAIKVKLTPKQKQVVDELEALIPTYNWEQKTGNQLTWQVMSSAENNLDTLYDGVYPNGQKINVNEVMGQLEGGLAYLKENPPGSQGTMPTFASEAQQTEVDPIEAEKKAKLEQAKKDFKESLRKSRGQANVSFVPIDPEVIANGVKLMAAYADLGIYKFKKIIEDIAESFGSDYLDKQNIDALKGVYSYYRSNLPKEERAAFDNEDAVDEFLENELAAYTSPNGLTEEQHLEVMVKESEDANDYEGADYYREELQLLKSKPFEYWGSVLGASQTNDDRANEAVDKLREVAKIDGFYEHKNIGEVIKLKKLDPSDGYAEIENEQGKPETILQYDLFAEYKETSDQNQNFQNGTSTASNLESDSTRREPGNEMGSEDVSARQRRDDVDNGETGTEIIQPVSVNSSPSLFPFDATTERAVSDSGIPIGEQFTGLETSDAGDTDSRGSDLVDDGGVSPVTDPTGTITGAATEVTRLPIEEKIKLQRAAESIPVVDMDIDNIRATLPFLLPGQHNDVLKAEKRLIGQNDNENELYGKGILFTNGTGTGKTLTGWGIAKRMIKRGKTNGLILAPTDVKVKDWMQEGKEYMGIDSYQLENTMDAGKIGGVSLTTYANFRENPNIQLRDFDWIVYDESHKINSNGQGSNTTAEHVHNQVATSPRVAKSKAAERINFDGRMAALREERINTEKTNGSFDYGRIKALEEELKLETIREFQKTKVIFLSATPFSYHPNLTYADGFLYSIRETFAPEYGRDSYNQFFISNFGYRIRYNKLTKPESGVDVDLLERQFTEGLKQKGVLSSRKLDIEQDYSREFISIDSEIGRKIDDGLAIIRNYDEFPLIAANYHRRFTFLFLNRLMENFKAQWAVNRTKEHLAMGRKVVIFHTYIENEPSAPFDFYASDILSPASDDYRKLQIEIDAFREKYPDLLEIKIGASDSPIETMLKNFKGKIVFFNGREKKKDRLAAKKLFQQDDSGIDVIMVQKDAGKEGISLHDITGKHQRALINLMLPYAPTDAIQMEGRTYRTGQKTDAIFEYPTLNLSFERLAYAMKINERIRTAENFALGEEARNMETAFKEGYINAAPTPVSAEQGKGGKKDDARMDSTNEFQKSLTYYYKRGKRTAADKRSVSGDYYATPEPLGMKMAEWMGLVPNEKGAEPSSGHGAIARFFPRTTKNVFIEPNAELRSETAINSFGTVMDGTFEDLNIINKFDGIAMNPPFGTGGKLAMEHLSKALRHLHDGGRAVALVPTGQFDNRFANWQDSELSEGFHVIARIKLPSVVFERAGTRVMTQIIVIDKVLDEELAKELPYQRNIDLSYIDNIKEFFDAIEDLSLPKRINPGQYAVEDTPADEQTQTSAPANGEAPIGQSELPMGNFPSANLAEVVKGFHAKNQHDTFVVKLNKRVSGEEFAQMKGVVTDLGGYYSAFKGSGAIPGFQFKTKEEADKALAVINGTAVEDGAKMTLADRIRAWKIAGTGKNLYSSIIPGGPQLWNAAVELVALSVQAGESLVDALRKGYNHIQLNWDKSWQKAKYNTEMILELKSRGVLSYTLSPRQQQEADDIISRIKNTGALLKEINNTRGVFEYAKSLLTDPQDIQDLEDSYNEFERYVFDQLSAHEFEKGNNFSMGLEDQTFWQKTKENIQNRHQRLEQVQAEIEKSGLTIDEKNDMVNRADRWKSIAAAKTQDVLREVGLSDVDVFIWKGQQKLDDSLFDRMAKDGVDYRSLNLFMYAKHAPERNAHNAKLRREAFGRKLAQMDIELKQYEDQNALQPSSILKGLITRKKNEIEAYEQYESAYNDPTGNKNFVKLIENKIDRRYILMDDGGSGMTNQQAQEILDAVEAENNTALFEQYASEISSKIIRKSLALKRDYGLIDNDNYEYMSNYYENYVPLQVEDKLIEEGVTFTQSGLPGAKIYKSKGANYYSFENRLNPITQAVIDLQATIYEGEQNEYKKIVAETIRTAPDRTVWAVKSATYVPLKDKKGKVVGLDEVNPPNTDKRFVSGMDNGIPYTDSGMKKYLVIHDKALYEAMTDANVKNAIPILSKINGLFRSLYTVYNPAFTVTNLFRDLETAGIVLSATQKGDVSGNFSRNLLRIGSIIKGVFQELGGSDNTYWQQRAKEYRDAGGNMSWFHLETSDEMIKDIEGAYEKYQKEGAFEKGKELAVKLADYVNRANSSIENSTRLATYDALLKAGIPQYKAVEIARNVTINFQKKGNYGPMVDSAYLFFNASIQGTTNMFRSLLTTKKGLMIAGGIVMTGMMMNIYNRFMGECGDGADQADCYDNIPMYEKERNIIIKTPGGKGFMKIPLAYGFNVFYNLGDQLGEMMGGKTNLAQISGNAIKMALNAFNPAGGSDQPILQQISPTATDPIVQYYTNRDAFGRPIYSDYPFDRRPDSEKAFTNDSRGAQYFAKWLNQQSGGDHRVKGKMDVAPGTLDFFFETFTGGLGQFTTQTVNSIWDGADPKTDVEVRKVPILNRFYTIPQERSNRSFIYEQVDNSYNTIMPEAEREKLNKEVEKAVRLGEMDKDRAKAYQNTVGRNQFRLNNPGTFSLLDRSKNEVLTEGEVDAFKQDLNNLLESGQITKEWARAYKTEMTKNQNKLK